jgi:hypothetical protein
MISNYIELKSLKKDLKKVRENLMLNLSATSNPNIDKKIIDSYTLINKHLIYNGLLTRLED